MDRLDRYAPIIALAIRLAPYVLLAAVAATLIIGAAGGIDASSRYYLHSH